MEVRDPQTHALIGLAMEVHSELGPGFLESVYHKALCRELDAHGIPYRSEVELAVLYKGEPLGAIFKPDLICFEEVVVELKANSALTSADEAQLINYLAVTGMKRGLLFNFGSRRLQYARKVLDYQGPL